MATAKKVAKKRVMRRAMDKMPSHWFHSKTPAQKKAYIAAHPKSKYAKVKRIQKSIKAQDLAKKNSRKAPTASASKKLETLKQNVAHDRAELLRLRTLMKKLKGQKATALNKRKIAEAKSWIDHMKVNLKSSKQDLHAHKINSY